MKLLVRVVLLVGLTAWIALAADSAPGGKGARRADGEPATRPAGSQSGDPARPFVGPRARRPLDAQPRRDADAPGPGTRRGAGPAANRPLGPGGDGPITPEQVEQIMSFARENFPVLHQRLQRLREVDPAAFRQILRKTREQFRPMIEAKQRDPRLAEKIIAEQKAQLAVLETARQYHEARTDAERSALRQQLEARVRERFERRQDRARLEIENLRRRLDDQARKLAEREQEKDQILRREMQRMMRWPLPGEEDNRRPQESPGKDRRE